MKSHLRKSGNASVPLIDGGTPVRPRECEPGNKRSLQGPSGSGGKMHRRQSAGPCESTELRHYRNPEGIDLAKYPPPPGFVVASATDMAKPGTPRLGWLLFTEGRWRPCSGPYYRREWWTYLRPATPTLTKSPLKRKSK